jgi:ATP-dependent protease HslVU (ClpYQ) peptidase subunit
MTTIAYKNGSFAYDSLITSGGVVTNHDAEKRQTHNGVQFFLTGAVSDWGKLIALYFGDNQINQTSPPIDASALVVDRGRLYQIAVDANDGFWKAPLDWNNHYAIGSGADFALTAMDMGAPASKAVEMAILRDIYSGGKVKTYLDTSKNNPWWR